VIVLGLRCPKSLQNTPTRSRLCANVVAAHPGLDQRSAKSRTLSLPNGVSRAVSVLSISRCLTLLASRVVVPFGRVRVLVFSLPLTRPAYQRIWSDPEGILQTPSATFTGPARFFPSGM
jgi:hypothetical protein